MGGRQENVAGLFSVVPNDRTRGNKHKLKHMKFYLNTQESWVVWVFFTMGVVKHEQFAQLYFGVSTFGNNQSPAGHVPGQPPLPDPALSWGLD